MAPTPGADIPIGAIVDLEVGRGIVRFNGNTQFRSGRWIGVELSEPKGKNDGSVEGVQYFSCKMKYGMFVRPTQIKSMQTAEEAMPPPPPPATAASATSGPSRPTHRSNGSISGAPSPLAMSRGPSNRSVESSRTGSPQRPTPPPSTQTPAARPRLVPPSTSTRRIPSASGIVAGTRVPTSPTAGRSSASIQQQLAQLPSRRGSQSAAIAAPTPQVPVSVPDIEVSGSAPSLRSRLLAAQQPSPSSVGSSPALQPSTDLASESSSPGQPREPSLPPSPRASPRATPAAALPDESHELRVKLRVSETKRADDQRRIRELEGRLQEAETFVALRPTLQAKLQSLVKENNELKRGSADHASQLQTLERKNEEMSEQMELLMLDKEVAEERAEVAEAELESEKEAKAELEVELEVWKKGNKVATTEDGEEVNPARTEMAFRQLEKQNERLRDALIRLRDITQETDMEQRRRISDLEKELASVDDIQAQYAQTLARLEHADFQVEDLKLQLDDALGAEEMLVQLTERNLMMGEKIEEMRITIEDLEALKELNDELEETHIETEKGLQDDLEQRENELRAQERKMELLQDGLQDYESTIQQFRDLVTNLQTELDTLREQDQSRQSEHQAQATQSAALLSLNMRLQSSAVKNQAKNIDLELRKLDSMQARELLGIIQPYLPQAYTDTDSDPTNCYMFFQRLSFKMDLINTIVASQHGLPESLNGTITGDLVGACDMRKQIAHLSTLCKRFSSVLRRCDAEMFLNAGRIYPEVSPLEKRVDMHIDLLRREEFRELECISDVAKMLAQFEHLGDTYFSKAEMDVGERELDFSNQIDYDLDTFYATIGLAKATIDATTQDEDLPIELGDLDLQATLFEPLDNLLNRLRAPRNLSKKLLKRMEDLIAADSAVNTKIVPQWINVADACTNLVGFGLPLAQAIATYVGDVRAQKHPFQLSSVLSVVRQTVNESFGTKGSPWITVEEAIDAVHHELIALTPGIMEPENAIRIVSGPPPWVARVEEIRAIAAVNQDAERAVAKLNDEILQLIKGVKTRDQTIQESAAKIELMERRMETVKQQADAINDLEEQLTKSHEQERDYMEAMDSLRQDYDTLENEYARIKQQAASAPDRSVSGIQPTEGEAPNLEGNYETSYLLEQIESLRNTVRFLRSENSYLKGQDLLREIHSLPDITPYRPATPPLSTSTSTTPDSTPPSSPDSRPSLRSLTTETKMLYREVINYSSSIRVVDLSKLNAQKGRRWIPQRQTPVGQLWEQKAEGEKLSRRVKDLIERANNFLPP